MTVCIATRCGQQIILASDRMLTSGDIQFEPDREKILELTSSIFVMTAGDASFLTMVLTRLNGFVHQLIEDNPTTWVTVADVVANYVRIFNDYKRYFAENALLAPLGLTHETFLDRQHSMSPDIVRRLMADLVNYSVPDCAVIIAGRDPTGTYIFTVDGVEVNAHETIGFAAVGMGARHAYSQLMLSRHAWNAPFSDALLRTYVAKRRSEIAPGVGTATDMVVIGPELGASVRVSDAVIQRLEQEYQRMLGAEQQAQEAALSEIAGYVSQLLAPPPTTPQEQAIGEMEDANEGELSPPQEGASSASGR